MSTKQKISIAVFLVVGFLLADVCSVYLGPIFTVRGNKIFNDDTTSSLIASAWSSRKKKNKTTPPPAPILVSLSDDFSQNYTVKESASMQESNNSNWWVSSGAYFYSIDGIGSTVVGALSSLDPWRVAYALSNSMDTDGGYHPQNIFRLVLRNGKWLDFTQEVYFKIVKDNLSESPNRAEHNGLLFFDRYQDAFNLYYAGIRVDGYAVIKKKINGTYYTMAYKKVFDGSAYDRTTNPNLLPHDIWMGMRSEVVSNLDGSVSIKLYLDKEKSGNWVLVAEAKDDGKSYGGSVFGGGYVGIRTDFMDVEFDDYKINQK